MVQGNLAHKLRSGCSPGFLGDPGHVNSSPIRSRGSALTLCWVVNGVKIKHYVNTEYYDDDCDN